MRDAVLTGTVEAVLVTMGLLDNRSTKVDSIQCFVGLGIKGDRHSGGRIMDVREHRMSKFGIQKGVEIANMRQFSAVSASDLYDIGEAMNLNAGVPYGCLGENIVVSGIDNFSQLPPNTMLFFTSPQGVKRSVVLLVYGENTPCRIPGEEIAKAFPDIFINPSDFPKAAINRRGVVGIVYASGKIKTGDTVHAYLP